MSISEHDLFSTFHCPTVRTQHLIDDPEEYQGYGVFVVPPPARWAYLAENAKGKPARGTEPARTIGSLIDYAMSAIMDSNESLRGTLPRLYNKDNIEAAAAK